MSIDHLTTNQISNCPVVPPLCYAGTRSLRWRLWPDELRYSRLQVSNFPLASWPTWPGVTKKHQKFRIEYRVFSQKSFLNMWRFEKVHIWIPKIPYQLIFYEYQLSWNLINAYQEFNFFHIWMCGFTHYNVFLVTPVIQWCLWKWVKLLKVLN